MKKRRVKDPGLLSLRAEQAPLGPPTLLLSSSPPVQAAPSTMSIGHSGPHTQAGIPEAPVSRWQVEPGIPRRNAKVCEWSAKAIVSCGVAASAGVWLPSATFSGSVTPMGEGRKPDPGGVNQLPPTGDDPRSQSHCIGEAGLGETDSLRTQPQDSPKTLPEACGRS